MDVVSDGVARRTMIDLARACLGRFLAIQSTRRRITDASASAVTAREAEIAGRPGPVYEDDEFPQKSSSKISRASSVAMVRGSRASRARAA